MPAITTIAQLEAIYGSPDETSTIKEVDRQTRAFVRIVLPLLVPALISCWLFVFLLAVRAVSLMLLLVGPDSQVVAVALFTSGTTGRSASSPRSASSGPCS